MTFRLPSAEVADGALRVVEIDGDEVVVCRHHGELYALANRCPHSGGPLALGKIDGDEIVCPWHGARFRLTDGRCTAGPSQDIRAYVAHLDGDEIVVEGA
jgi:3-phenylpropionate/trans-cinnamate dioxygenase ferredoxin subunit